MDIETCDRCGKFCNSKGSLARHKKSRYCAHIAQVKENREKLTCPFCEAKSRDVKIAGMHFENCVARVKISQLAEYNKSLLRELEYLKTINSLMVKLAEKSSPTRDDNTTVFADGDYVISLTEFYFECSLPDGSKIVGSIESGDLEDILKLIANAHEGISLNIMDSLTWINPEGKHIPVVSST